MNIASELSYSTPYRGFTAFKAAFSHQTFIYLMSRMVLFPWCFLVGLYAFYYEGCEASVRRTVAELRCNIHDIFVPLSYEPAEAVQVDWGEATIILGGCKQKIQIWCMRECYSGDIFVTAFYRQNEESLLLQQHERYQR